MRVGIVGNGSDKFTVYGEYVARGLILRILAEAKRKYHPHGDAVIFVSGHSPVGGIDIWGEEIATGLGLKLDLKVPEVNQWNPPGRYGYKARNLDIAKSNIVHVIVADNYPPKYDGMRFDLCYHCGTADHVKSGGCWTGKQALRLGNQAYWHIVPNG